MPESTTREPQRQPYDLDRVVRLVIGSITVIALIWLLRLLSDVLIPFAIAILLAYLINPIVSFLERKLRSRTAATLLTVAGCLLVLVGLVMVLVPLVSSELADFGKVAEQLKSEAPVLPDAQKLRKRFQAFVDSQQNEFVKQLLIAAKDGIVGADYRAILLEAGKRIAPGVWNLVTGALSLLLGASVLIIILLFLVFISIDYASFSGQWHDYLPPKYREPIVGFAEEFSLAMSRYFRGQFLIASTVGVLFALGFWIIDLRMGILLGLFIGVLNMVPYLQTVALVPALALGLIRALEHGSGVGMSLALVLLVFGVVQAIQDGLLTPLIMGKTTGLKPVTIMLGLFVWGKLLGFLGLLLAIPLTCLALAYYRRFVLGQRGATAVLDQSPS
ncbi:MAG: AI-2E family transporter [Phycisphaerae bacterium]|nr:AI-2E family transporter [Phycisphaerae bacterium]